jgi:hypothetical protein
MSLQVLAAFLALRVLFSPGPRRLPWAAFCLGLALSVPQCWRPLELALHTGLYDFYQAVLAFFIACLMLLTVWGLTPFLRPGVRQEKTQDHQDVPR